MARSQQAQDGSGRAGRLAAGRRPRGRGDVDKPAPSGAGKGRGKKGKASAPSAAARLVKLVLLLAFMAVLGFAVVLVVDVGVTLVGSVRFGQTTFADLFDKVSDRVLDRDVPQARPAKKVTKPKTTTTTTRAPLAAPPPEDYARHVGDAVDPEVQAAKQRLDQLLNRL